MVSCCSFELGVCEWSSSWTNLVGVPEITETRLAYAHLGSELSCLADNLLTILNSGYRTATCENGMSGLTFLI